MISGTFINQRVLGPLAALGLCCYGAALADGYLYGQTVTATKKYKAFLMRVL